MKKHRRRRAWYALDTPNRPRLPILAEEDIGRSHRLERRRRFWYGCPRIINKGDF